MRMMMLKIIKITKIMMRVLKMVMMTTILRKKAVKVLPTVQLTSQGSGAIVIKTEAEGLPMMVMPSTPQKTTEGKFKFK